MQRGKLLFAVGVLFLLCRMSVSAQNAAPDSSNRIVYTLQQCVDSAVRNSPTVKTAEFLKETALTNRDQQISTMLPYINSYANYLNNGGKSINNYTNSYVTENYNSGYANVQATLTLFNGLSIHNFIKQYSLLYEANKKDWQQAKDLATVNVILAYLNILSAEEQLGMAKRQADATREKVRLLEAQNNEGAISPSDLTDMKGQLASDEMTVVTTENTIETNKLQLAQYMNVPYSPHMEVAPLAEDLTPVAYNATVDQIYTNATQNLAQVKAAQLHQASAEKGVKAAWGNMTPTLSFYGLVQTNYSTAASTTSNTTSYYSQDGSYVTYNGSQLPVNFQQYNTANHPISFSNQVSNNLYTQFGLTLSVPILQNLHYRTLYRQARINLEQAKYNTNTTFVQLRQAVESYYVTMMNDFRIYSTLNDQVTNYAESFRSAEIKYNAGAMKSVDFIIYKTNIDRARLNQIQAKYNYILQTKVLDYYQGKLTW
jgi:outer membrane protein